jgi:hypothetical protein
MWNSKPCVINQANKEQLMHRLVYCIRRKNQTALSIFGEGLDTIEQTSKDLAY